VERLRVILRLAVVVTILVGGLFVVGLLFHISLDAMSDDCRLDCMLQHKAVGLGFAKPLNEDRRTMVSPVVDV
jgi:hypothetical protein